MAIIHKLEIKSDVPIAGCELTPTLNFILPDGTWCNVDVPESAPVAGVYMSYKWYRVMKDSNAPRCHVHPSEPATLQCLRCSKCSNLVAKSYHCSSKCFEDAWPDHMVAHEKAGNSQNNYQVNNYQQDEVQCEVGQSITYIPKTEDVGWLLKLECSVVSVQTKKILETRNTIKKIRVAPSPTPIHRNMITSGQPGTFTVLSYNTLSDTSATSRLYSYCQPWARLWTYRRLSLLREIVSYGAAVVCLQDVEYGHLVNFFAPELNQRGYDFCYKKRTNQVLRRNEKTIDCCATFYKRDMFSLVRESNVEFNNDVQGFVEANILSKDKEEASKRLIKDNIALIVILEAKNWFDPSGKLQQICIANTRLDVKPELKDVVLWHVHKFLEAMKRLPERSNDISMILCGGFGMAPGSAAHSLVLNRHIPPTHDDLRNDPVGIMRAHTNMANLQLMMMSSAYTAFRRLEPVFTTFTKEFKETHDYIFYRGHALKVLKLMEMVCPTEKIPSVQWPSSHLALLAQFFITDVITW